MRGNHAKCAESDKDEDFFSNAENHAKCVKIMQNNVPRTPGSIILQLKITQNAPTTFLQVVAQKHAKCAEYDEHEHFFSNAENHAKCRPFLAV